MTDSSVAGAIASTSTAQTPDAPAESLLSLGDDALLERLGHKEEGDEPAPPAKKDEPAPAIEDTPDEPDADVDPEADVDAPDAKPEGTKTTPAFFSLRTGDGEEVEHDPDVQITYKVNGKEVSETLDQVVRKAAGRGGQEAKTTEEMRELRDYRERAETTIPRVKELIDKQRSEIQRLIEDDEYRTQRREEWAEENTPAKQLERERQARIAAEKRLEERDESEHGTRFLNDEVSPALEGLVQRYPHVDSEVIVDRFASLCRHLMGADGRVKRSAYPEVRRIITEQLEPWAKSRHEKVAGVIGAATSSAKASADKQVNAAQVKATLARRTLTRPLKGAPVRAGAPTAGAAPARTNGGKPKARTVDDSLDDLTDRLVEGIS